MAKGNIRSIPQVEQNIDLVNMSIDQICHEIDKVCLTTHEAENPNQEQNAEYLQMMTEILDTETEKINQTPQDIFDIQSKYGNSKGQSIEIGASREPQDRDFK